MKKSANSSDNSSLTSLTKQELLRLGFDDVGIASATNGTPMGQHFLNAMTAGRLGPLDYMDRTAEVRADIQKLLPGAQSVVVVVKNYYAGNHPDGEFPKISRYAWGGDYHHWFKKRLRKIRTWLNEQDPSAQVHIFNDTGPVLERAWAQAAGLGFIGKSGMFIHRRFGTWTFLGGFVTNLPFIPDKPEPKQFCGSCTACMDACPTQAIEKPQTVDATRCLTMWNVERPLHPSAENPQLHGHGWAIGCDICQEVCPWNKFEKMTDESRFHPRSGHTSLNPDAPPNEILGTPLARAGVQALPLIGLRAKKL